MIKQKHIKANQKRFDKAVEKAMRGYDSKDMMARYRIRKEVQRLRKRLKLVNAYGWKF